MKSILQAITTPQDLKNLSISDLDLLAREIRQLIIEVLATNGGHLASNLGAVELTIALHRVFNSPKDKLIWDIGHQTYTHKILTGRRDQFSTVRQYGGLSGFCHPQESSHDHFHTGHAGQALSLALGAAVNRDLLNRHEHILPILGDAALTCGLTLEALNNICCLKKNFVIILNDNNMSISQNVGHISRLLHRGLPSPIRDHLDSSQKNGSVMSQDGGVKAREGNSPDLFFAQFGLSYIGPVDGHNTQELVDVLEKIKDRPAPVIVHVLTRKGQGMSEAINNPTPYHGARPFDRYTGKFLPVKNRARTFPKIFGSHLLKMAERDHSVVAVTPAMSAGSCLEEMMNKFPHRCFDVGIAEGHAVTFAGGLAYGKNLKVVACLYSTFLQRAFDNIYHDICLQDLPVVFAIDRAGISGGDGAMANGLYDIGFLLGMPNMIIAQPRDGKVLVELLESAFSYGSPTAIRYPNTYAEEPSGPLMYRKKGEGEVLVEGKDLLIIALGTMSLLAKEVCSLLREEGIYATIFDPIFIKPLDKESLSHLLTSHQRVVTLEENSLQNGIGSVINNFLFSRGYSHVQVANFGVADTFVQQGSHKQLLEEVGLSAEKIVSAIYLQLFCGAQKVQSV